MSKKRHRCDHEGGCSVRKEQNKRGGQNPIWPWVADFCWLFFFVFLYFYFYFFIFSRPEFSFWWWDDYALVTPNVTDFTAHGYMYVQTNILYGVHPVRMYNVVYLHTLGDGINIPFLSVMQWKLKIRQERGRTSVLHLGCWAVKSSLCGCTLKTTHRQEREAGKNPHNPPGTQHTSGTPSV